MGPGKSSRGHALRPPNGLTGLRHRRSFRSSLPLKLFQDSPRDPLKTRRDLNLIYSESFILQMRKVRTRRMVACAGLIQPSTRAGSKAF